MKITYSSIGELSITEVRGVQVGCSVDTRNKGIEPTYGMTAGDMGFQTFIMTVKWG